MNTTIQTHRGIDGVQYDHRIAVKRIEITRAEGPSALCDKLQTATGWAEADDVLRCNSITAPKTGGYDKHDFKVIFEDGLEYEGRYDLKHWEVEPADLAQHVRSFVQWCAYDPAALRLVKPEQVESAKDFLKDYDVRQGAGQ